MCVCVMISNLMGGGVMPNAQVVCTVMKEEGEDVDKLLQLANSDHVKKQLFANTTRWFFANTTHQLRHLNVLLT